MDTQLFELKNSLKTLTKNLISRIDSICISLENGEEIDRLLFWLEDLSMLTETTIILSQNNMIDIDLDLFNEKVELLLDKVEEKDYLFVSDLLKYELEPLLSYWDGCITND
ncbi:hypothetical protein OR571_22265 [Psychrobacillus sp. NEAU-3TGS]|uniref:hypothetical protein n=1 Tax=Psychrobacillus sp. NEAU-3TGS TaxID=2995412 RepID=UPI0024983B00|nr:hypothetical protein [Psychrobacillus sp. NEAU-3TGS]MDI2589754.1 hypothetical protein [Psychrobacillus sp. NEAU-3TGS]